MKRFRRYLLEGIVLVVPVGAAAWVLFWLFTRLDRILGAYIGPLLGRTIPGLGLIALVLLLLVAGWVAERALGRRATGLLEWVVNRVPVARPVYGATRRILQSIVGQQESRAFRHAVLVEYPSPGTWSVAFETGAAPAGSRRHVGETGVTVFLPTAPNPMSGFLLILPRDRVHRLDVSTEAAFTFVVSMGAVPMPEDRPGVEAAVRKHAAEGDQAPGPGSSSP